MSCINIAAFEWAGTPDELTLLDIGQVANIDMASFVDPATYADAMSRPESLKVLSGKRQHVMMESSINQGRKTVE
jgi:hypothetical protein